MCVPMSGKGLAVCLSVSEICVRKMFCWMIRKVKRVRADVREGIRRPGKSPDAAFNPSTTA